MAYPIDILPRPGYKLIDCDLSEFFLLRIVFPKENETLTDPETGKIKLEYICSPRERIIDLSFNLLGIYKSEYISIQLTDAGKEKYSHYCPPDTQVEIPELDIDYINEDNRSFWCIPINKLHEHTFPYEKGEETFSTICLVVHTPMLWNFWHFSLHWKINDQIVTSIQKENKRTAQKIGHNVRVILSQFLKIGLPDDSPVLQSECFTQN